MNRIFFLQIILLPFFIECHAKLNLHTDSIIASDNANDTSKYFTIVDVMPEFPGGQDAMLEFIVKNLKSSGLDVNCSSRVIIGFIVEPTGELTDIKIIRS